MPQARRRLTKHQTPTDFAYLANTHEVHHRCIDERLFLGLRKLRVCRQRWLQDVLVGLEGLLLCGGDRLLLLLLLSRLRQLPAVFGFDKREVIHNDLHLCAISERRCDPRRHTLDFFHCFLVVEFKGSEEEKSMNPEIERSIRAEHARVLRAQHARAQHESIVIDPLSNSRLRV
jgi:hypothetical protein